MKNLLESQQIPTINDMSKYIHNPLFEIFIKYMKDEYQIKLSFEFSRCSWRPGWNIKMKKSGKNLCTVYPAEGFFVVMIVIGKNEKERFEEQFETFTPYLKDLYMHTKEGMGQRWLEIVFEDEYIFDDIKKCLSIKCNSNKKYKS